MPITFAHAQPGYNPNREHVRGVYINNTLVTHSWAGSVLSYVPEVNHDVLVVIRFKSRMMTTRTNTYSSPYLIDEGASEFYYRGSPISVGMPVQWKIRPGGGGLYLALLFESYPGGEAWIKSPVQAVSSWLPPFIE
jgi:hypothetical protein